MFTGIVQKVGEVKTVQATGDLARTVGPDDSSQIIVRSGYSDLSQGESIAINGVCLTVTEFTPAGDVSFFISPETLARSNLRYLKPGSKVNLERAMQAHERLSGHIVQGHVDGQGFLRQVIPHAESHEIEIELPADLTRYCVEKGSISIDGTSLTINTLQGNLIRIMLIPHTWTHTNLSARAIGDAVNVEVDVLAKYVEQLCRPYLKR